MYRRRSRGWDDLKAGKYLNAVCAVALRGWEGLVPGWDADTACLLRLPAVGEGLKRAVAALLVRLAAEEEFAVAIGGLAAGRLLDAVTESAAGGDDAKYLVELIADVARASPLLVAAEAMAERLLRLAIAERAEDIGRVRALARASTALFSVSDAEPAELLQAKLRIFIGLFEGEEDEKSAVLQLISLLLAR